ncbi:MAG: sugar-transfer associated ATP-grasp domain-containing protein [Steroidobacter sp.]
MNASTMSRQLARAGRGSMKAARRIWDLTTDQRLSQSYYPDEPTKSKPRVLMELLWWLVRSGEINNYYYVYGLDRKSVDRRQELLPYRKFRRIRNTHNLRIGRAPYNYVCVLRDKFVFSQFVGSLGIATPRSLALLDADRVTWLDTNVTVPLRSIIDRAEVTLDGFCKKLGGIQGDGAFPLRIDAGSLFVRDARISVSELRNRLDDRYLLQERIRQHEGMSALHPGSVNTIRLVTFARGAAVELFAAAMRVGTKGKSVDNWAAGGLIVGIDPARGELRGEGFYKPGYGGRMRRHPDSGIELQGFKIPYFTEAVALATRLHGYLSEIHSIGWDVAITPDGPTIIEGNDDWEGGIPMVLERDFRKRFLEMCRSR